jgi:hypothetical protein
MRKYVSHTEKKSAFGQRYQVSAVGGIGANGSFWRLDEGEVIRQIESGERHYFIVSNGRVCDLTVGAVPEGKYLRTAADTDMPHSLLSLPDFDSEACAISLA